MWQRPLNKTEAYVWAVDYERAPAYWFPRNCPRVLTWASALTTSADRELLLGTAWRVHAIEYRWLASMQSTVLYAYRFAASDFTPFGSPEPHAQVATTTARPWENRSRLDRSSKRTSQRASNSASYPTCGRTGSE